MPLHLAVADHYRDIVRLLLKADLDGMIPSTMS